MKSVALIVCAVFVVAISGVNSRNVHGQRPLNLQKRSTPPTCDRRARFRTIDGSCNNLAHPEWGMVGQSLVRLLSNAYDDNAGAPRARSVNNNQALPDVRVVSQTVHTPNDTRADVTLMVMQWGQFLDHDITLTPESAEDGHHVECVCGTTNEDCFNIPIRNDDEHFSARDCLEFIRSEGTTRQDQFDPSRTIREQTNIITSYIDASQVYSVSDEELSVLRAPRGGRMAVERNVGDNLPLLPRDSDDACILQPGEYCFNAGDFRVMDMPGLAAMHTIFVREHNRISRYFRTHTDWDDERVFQESRKIVGAIMQRITYAEFLPTILSPVIMEKFGLFEESCYKYDPDTNPNIINAFATAGFRFGHSLIPDQINHGGQLFDLKNMFQSPTANFQRFAGVVGALPTDLSMQLDGHFQHSITRHLVATPTGAETDLISLNLQRGRDHGLPGYNNYRELSGQNRLSKFRDLESELKTVYKNVDDIDLFTGGMLEQPFEGGLLGETFSNLLGLQFQRLKFGDRFFYQNRNRQAGFTLAQIREIMNVRLSRVVCANSEVTNIQEHIFRPADDETNPAVPCRRLPRMDLSKFIRD